MDNGVRLLALEGLHTKLYLIDDSTAIMGSANFTNGGLKNNHELSLYIQDEPEILAPIICYAKSVISDCENANGIITKEIMLDELQKINEEQEAKNLIKQELKYEKYSYGAKRSKNSKTRKQKKEKETAPTIWLKIVGRSDDANRRKNESEQYWGREKIYSKALNGLAIAFGKGKTPKARKGDIIYMVLLSADATGKLDRYFVGKGISKGFNKKQDKGDEFVKEHAKDAGWKWPVYLELESVQLLADKAMPRQGMSLSELWAHSKRHPDNYTPRSGWERLTIEEAQFLEQNDNLFDEQLLS